MLVGILIKPGKPYYLIILCISIWANAAAQSVSIEGQWLKNHLHPISHTRANDSSEDLSFLKNLVGSREIVGLGEATHGTSEFFQLKHRILKYLVENMGFRTFAIEAYEPYCEAVNDYVINGKGKLNNVVVGMGFWTWSTKEVADMVQWMHDYNLGKADSLKIHFYGFDMQSSDASARLVLQYSKNNGITLSGKVNNDLKALEHRSWKIERTLAREIKPDIDSFEASLTKYSKPDTSYAHYLHNVELLRQFLERMSNPKEPNYRDVRDKYMAENIKWIHNQPDNQKMVLWAHNYHISKDEKNTSMGYHLKEIFGDEYYNIGFCFYEGKLRAIGRNGNLNTWQAKPAERRSVERFFHQVDSSIFLVDLDAASRSDSTSGWINKPVKWRNLGAVYYANQDYGYYSRDHLQKLYNALIFVDHTTASVPVYITPDFGNAMHSLSAKPYRGKKIKITMEIRLDSDTTSGTGHLWLRVDRKNRKEGFFYNMDDNPVTSAAWRHCEITGKVSKDATYINYGVFLTPNGKLYADDFHFFVWKHGHWNEVTELANSFEKDTAQLAPKSWRAMTPAYKIIVIKYMKFAGDQCLMIRK